MAKSYWIAFPLLTLILLGCATEGRKSIPPELENRIVFLCSEGICTINADGGDQKVIVSSEDGGPFSDVRWSPDKRRIGFTGHLNGRKRIFLIDSEGSNRKVLSLPHNTQFQGWSSSGKYISCRNLDVYDAAPFAVMTTKGKVIARLNGSYPTCGGSDEIVYVGPYGGPIAISSDIFIYDLKSHQERNLTNIRGKEFAFFNPEISNDGTMITYLRYAHPREVELWVMQSDGSGKRKLATSGKDFAGSVVTEFGFSPNGDMIMFISSDGQIGQVYIINSDGTKLRPIMDRIVNAAAGVSWSADGKRIVFTSAKDGNDELYIVNVDGTSLKRLTNNTTMDCCPDW